MSDTIGDFQNQFRDNIVDFINFWYKKNRFKYRPIVGYVHDEYKSKNFNINKDGFRSKVDYHSKLNLKNNKKIFFIGPSSLVGIPNLCDEEILSASVEKKINIAENTYSCFNYGLIGSNINSQFSLLFQLLLENVPEYVVIVSCYNDMVTGYHGQKFEYYNDVDYIFRKAFHAEKNTDGILYNLDNLATAISNKIYNKIFFKLKIDDSNYLKNNLTLKRIKILKKINKRENTYNFCQQNILSYLKLCFFLLNSLNIKSIFIPETSVLSTNKPLSDYENDFVKVDGNFGVYKNTDREKDRLEFKKIYNETSNLAYNLAKTMNIRCINFEKIISQLTKKETVFFDDIHLTKYGTDILANEIISTINQ